jgi:hypothetical protein
VSDHEAPIWSGTVPGVGAVDIYDGRDVANDCDLGRKQLGAVAEHLAAENATLRADLETAEREWHNASDRLRLVREALAGEGYEDDGVELHQLIDRMGGNFAALMAERDQHRERAERLERSNNEAVSVLRDANGAISFDLVTAAREVKRLLGEVRDRACSAEAAHGDLACERDAADALLRRLEWSLDGGDYCPICQMAEPHHSADCALAAHLRGDTATVPAATNETGVRQPAERPLTDDELQAVLSNGWMQPGDMSPDERAKAALIWRACERLHGIGREPEHCYTATGETGNQEGD